MSESLIFFLLVILLIQLILIINTVKKRKLSMRYASFWIFLIILMALVVLFPNFLFKLSDLFGFEKASNMIFLLGFFFLFYIIFILTLSISIQNEKIKILIQEISLLKEKNDCNGKEK